MRYDDDKTPQVLSQLKDAARDKDLRRAMKLLRHADAGGRLRSGSGLVSALRSAVGETAATAIVSAFAAERCPYCKHGRDTCEDCEGKGAVGNRVCRPCAGLGLRRCPFCNGTALAGYDMVPRGLRAAVMWFRMDGAEEQIARAEARAPRAQAADSARALAGQVIALDRCRGVLANAAEQVRLDEAGTIGGGALFTPADAERIRRSARALNLRAEHAMRGLLARLAEGFAHRAERSKGDPERRRLVAHRARAFATLSRSEGFGDSALRTPAALLEE